MKTVGNKKKIKCECWNPKFPDKKWNGIISWKRGKRPVLEFHVIGDSYELLVDSINEIDKIIYGVDLNKNPITIIHPLIYRKWPPYDSSKSSMTEQWTADRLIIGEHINDVNEPFTDNIILQLQNFHEWVGRSNVSSKHTADGKCIFERRPSDGIKFQSDLKLSDDSDNIPVNFEIYVGYSTSSSFKLNNISECSTITIKTDDRLSIKNIKRIIEFLRYIIHISTLKKCYLTSLSYIKLQDDKKNEINILSPELKQPNSESLFPDKFIFTFNDIKENIGESFSEWWKYYWGNREFFSCYLSTVYFESLPPSMTHLSLTQAIEAYFKNDYKKIQNKCKECGGGLACKECGKDYTTKRFMEFKDKIHKMVEPYYDKIVEWVDIGGYKHYSLEDFLKRVVETRNYYTHHNDDIVKNEKIAVGLELDKMNDILKTSIQLKILDDMGIKNPKCGIIKFFLSYTVHEFI